MGMQVQDGHVTTVEGQICPHPCVILLKSKNCKEKINIFGIQLFKHEALLIKCVSKHSTKSTNPKVL